MYNLVLGLFLCRNINTDRYNGITVIFCHNLMCNIVHPYIGTVFFSHTVFQCIFVSAIQLEFSIGNGFLPVPGVYAVGQHALYIRNEFVFSVISKIT